MCEKIRGALTYTGRSKDLLSNEESSKGGEFFLPAPLLSLLNSAISDLFGASISYWGVGITAVWPYLQRSSWPKADPNSRSATGT